MEVFVGRDGVPKLIIAIGPEIWVSTFPFTNDFVKVGAGFVADAPVIFTKTVQSVIQNSDGTISVIEPIPYLVMTNGIERARLWDGNDLATSNPNSLIPGIPIGKWTVWSGNRLWISNKNKLEASDLGNPLSFFESTYVAGGGALYTDDYITGLSQTADFQNMIVGTDYDITAIQSNIYDRTTWGSTTGFQRVIFPGVGCAAGKSFVRQWGVVWWMSHGGWVGIDQALMTYQRSRIQYRDQQMMRAKSRLSGDKSGIVADKFGNHLLVAVPYGSRHNSATWVLNQRVLDLAAPSPAYDVNDPAAWSSQWTGIFPVDFSLCVVNGQERIFALSRHITPQGAIQPIVWELFTGERQDRYNDQVFHPPCTFESRLLAFSDDIKTFHYSEIDVSELTGIIDVQAFMSGRRGNYKQVMDKRIIASPGSVNSSITSVPTAQVIERVFTGQNYILVNSTFGFLPGEARLNIEGRSIEYLSIDENAFVIASSPSSFPVGAQVTQPQFDLKSTIFTSYVPQRRMLRTEEFDVSQYLCSPCEVESDLTDNIDRGFSMVVRWIGKMAINGIRMFTQKAPDQAYGKCEEQEQFSQSVDQYGCGSSSGVIQESDAIDSASLKSQYLRSVTHKAFLEDRYNPPYEVPPRRIPNPLPLPPKAPPVPGHPLNFSGTPGNNQVDLSWDPVPEALTYTIYRATSPFVIIKSGLRIPNYTDEDVSNGITYKYFVTASNKSGEGDPSAEIIVTPTSSLPGSPPPPTDLAGVPGFQVIDLSWTASPGALFYQVKRSLTPMGPYTTIASPAGVDYSDTGITEVRPYYYVVSAVNEIGESDNSSEIVIIPLTSNPPIAPTGLEATPGDEQILLSWNIVSNADTYTLKRSLSEGGPYDIVASGITALLYLDEGLVNDTPYYYVVSSTNEFGESPDSGEVTSTPVAPPPPPPEAPPPPDNVLAVPGNAQVVLSWDAAIGSDNYNVKRSVNPGGPYTIIANTLNTGFTNIGLVNGTTYYYVISSVSNEDGEGANSLEVNATPVLPIPAPPAGLSAIPGNTQVSLSWTASPNAASYKVKRALVTGGPYTTIATGRVPTNYLDTGLTNGTSYFYVVSAVNTSGESANSSEVTSIPMPPIPPAPTSLVAAPGNSSIHLSWNSSLNATSYKVKRSLVNGGPYTTIATGVLVTSFDDTGLDNGTPYYYRVSAVNIAGESANSNQANATPIAQPIYPKGIWCSIGQDENIDAGLANNPAVVGVMVGADWSVVQPTELGPLDWTFLYDKIEAARVAGFDKLTIYVSNSPFHAPLWLLNRINANTPDECLKLLDIADNHPTFGMEMLHPVWWNLEWRNARLALLTAFADEFRDHQNMVATFGSGLNHHSMDWNNMDFIGTIPNIPQARCPGVIEGRNCITKTTNTNGSCNALVDQEDQWMVAGWNRSLVLDSLKEYNDAVAVEFPTQAIKFPLGGLGNSGNGGIGAPGFRLAQTGPPDYWVIDGKANYSTLVREITDYIFGNATFGIPPKLYANRVFISRNTFKRNSQTWEEIDANPPALQNANYPFKMIHDHLTVGAGIQTASSISGCTPFDGTRPCNENNNVPIDDRGCPWYSLPGSACTDTVNNSRASMQAILDGMTSYVRSQDEGLTFLELWTADASNPDFYAMTLDATIQMFGTPRPVGGGGGGVTTQNIANIGSPPSDPTCILSGTLYIPDSAVHPPPWPCLTATVAGRFADGNISSLAPILTELADNGFLCLGHYVRLLQSGNPRPGQTTNARWKQQTDDMKIGVRAMRSNPFGLGHSVTGWVGCLGGSGSAHHALYMALDGTVGDDKADASICLSPPTDFSNREGDVNQNIIDILADYGNNGDDTNLPLLLARSPISLNLAAAKPIRHYNGTSENMPHSMLTRFSNAMSSAGAVGYVPITNTGQLGNKHSYDMWNFSPTLRADCIAWLISQL